MGAGGQPRFEALRVSVVTPGTFLHAEPNGDAEVVWELMPRRDTLEPLDGGRQTNGYYHVALSGTRVSGWVDRTRVLLHRYSMTGDYDGSVVRSR